MKAILKYTTVLFLAVSLIACASDSEGEDSAFTGNEISFTLIPGEVGGNTTTGTLTIKERTDGRGEIQITLNGVIEGAQHPVHLHFGDLEADGLVATYLTQVSEVDGVGSSITILDQLDDGTPLDYSTLITFNGSVKIHFEESGPLEDAILGATNIGINSGSNEAYLLGVKDITTCNNDFQRN